MKRSFPGEQRRLKKNKFLSRIIAIGILLFFAYLLWFWKDLLGLSRWDGQRRLNIVIESDKILLVSIEPAERAATVVNIPQNAYLSLPFGYGDYKAGSIYSLGELDSKRGGGILLSATFQSVFGLPIDGYIVTPATTRLNMKSLDFLGLMRVVQMMAFERSIHTNLSISEVVRFLMAYDNLRADQVKFYELENYNILDDVTLPDHTRVSRLDSDKLDKTFEGLFIEKEILKENISISVLNATRQEGIATGVARIINNIGGKVVEVGNSEALGIKCLVKVANNQSSSYTVFRLRHIFGCELGGMTSEGEHSDLIMFIGEGYIK